MLAYKKAYETAREKERALWSRMEEISRVASAVEHATNQRSWPVGFWEEYRQVEREWTLACHATERARRTLVARAGTF